MSYRDPDLAGQELTDRERQVLEAHDQGLTDQQIADKFGYASSNGAGNVRRVAMTKANRGHEISRGNRGGSRAPKVTTAEEMLRNAIEAADATVNSLTERLNEARESASAQPAQLVSAERSRLEERVKSAEAALESFTSLSKKDRDEWVHNQREQAQNKLAALENELTSAIETARTEKEKMTQMAEAIGVTL